MVIIIISVVTIQIDCILYVVCIYVYLYVRYIKTIKYIAIRAKNSKIFYKC